MNRLGFLILSILKKLEAINRLSSMTIKEIASVEDFEWKESTIFKKIKEFEQSGYVERGLKEGRAATFFITQKGIDYLDGERSR